MNNQAISGYCDSAQGTHRTAGRQQSGFWLKYSCKACFNQVWYDYQPKKTSWHTPTLKKTCKVAAAADHLPLRYMISYFRSLAASMKPFRSRKGHCADEMERLCQAWSKATCWPLAPGGGPYGRVS